MQKSPATWRGAPSLKGASGRASAHVASRMSAAALNTLSGDLAFAVGYAIASELLAVADTQQYSQQELVAMVLGISVLLSSLNGLLQRQRADAAPRSDGPAAAGGGGDAKPPSIALSQLSAFALSLLQLAQRLAQSVAVQLLSSSVRSNSPFVGVRVLSLLSVAVFFVFLESTSTAGAAPAVC